MKELFQYSTPGAAGIDLRSVQAGVVHPGERALFDTGVKFKELAGRADIVVEGDEASTVLELQVRSRSSLFLKQGILIFPGTVDSDWEETILVMVWNTGHRSFTVEVGDRIAQGVFNYAIRPRHIPVMKKRRGTEPGSTGNK